MRDLRKIIGTLIGIMGFIAAMAGLTYALQTFSASGIFGNTNNVLRGSCVSINYQKGNDVTASELDFHSSHTESPIQTTITFYQNPSEECGNNIGTIHINTSSTTSSSLLSSGVLKYTIEKKIGTNSVSETYTGTITQTGDTTIEVGKLENENTTYKVYIWLENPQNGSVTNETISEAQYSGYIHASARQGSTFES